MNCSDIAETLDSRNIAQLGAAERQDIEAHLAACPECARDWELHVAFSALPDMQEPNNFAANCFALVAAGSSTGRSQRVRSHLVLIGVIAAVAAAAAMLAIALREPEQAPLAALQRPVAPISEGGEATSAIAVPEEQKTAVTKSAHVETANPVTESAKFTVRVLPVSNNGADAASRAAINELHAAVVRELQAIPGLTLVDADSAGTASEVPVNYQVRVRGNPGRGRDSFSAQVYAEKLGPDGKMLSMAGTSTIAAAACPDDTASKPFNCHDAASIASLAVKQIRMTLFPFDLAAQRLLQAALTDTRLGFEERLAALSALARRSDIAGLKDARSDSAVVHGAIDLATSNADEAQRAHVWRIMRGARHPDLIQPLIAAARQGPDREVQQEAVATLAGFADDARARDELQTIARTDPRPLVRALAQRGLSGESYWNEYVSESLKDASRPDAERIEAFMYHAIRTGPSVDSVSSATPQALRDVLDDGAIQALAVLLPRMNALKGPSRSRTGLVLINVASAIDHPAISKMLLDNLTQSADRLSWMGIAEAVVRFRGSDPALRGTLENIASEDADPKLREAAERVLQVQPAPVVANPGPAR